MRWYILIFLLLFFPFPETIIAQEYTLPVDEKHETVITESMLLKKGFFRSSISYSMATISSRFFDDNWKVHSDGISSDYPMNINAISSGFLAGFRYGLKDKLNLGINIPYNIDQLTFVSQNISDSYNIHNSTKYSSITNGLGDISADIMILLLKHNQRTVDFTEACFWFSVQLPTGKKNHQTKDGNNYMPTGTGAIEFEPTLKAKLLRQPFSYSFFASTSYKFGGTRNSTYDGVEYEVKDGFFYLIWFELGYKMNSWFSLINGISYTHQYPDRSSDKTVIALDIQKVDYSLSMYFQVKNFRLAEVGKWSIAGKNFPIDPSYSLQLAYTF